LKQKGVEAKFQEYYRAWVLGFFGFFKPKKVAELAMENVEEFIGKLSATGKKEWQLRQAFGWASCGHQANFSSSQARAFV